MKGFNSYISCSDRVFMATHKTLKTAKSAITRFRKQCPYTIDEVKIYQKGECIYEEKNT